jgi:hypothetical protein
VTKALRLRGGYQQQSTLLATSLCCDEVNRALEDDFANLAYGNSFFRMGGLAGFPFCGVTGFQALTSHIPDGGSCLIVYGPHCGVDSLGHVGTVPRRGKRNGGACCGSAKAAADYVLHNSHAPRLDPLDFQQHAVVSQLLPYAGRIRGAPDALVEVSFCLYDAQDTMLHRILKKSHESVKNKVIQIALLGGIEINTPSGESDYFLPLRFDLQDSVEANPENLLRELDQRHHLRL